MKACLKFTDGEVVELIDAEFAACPSVGDSIFTTSSPVPAHWQGHFCVVRVTWRYSNAEEKLLPTLTLARRSD